MRTLTIAALIILASFLSACDRDVLDPEARGIALELVAQGLTAPVLLVEPPDGTGRLFVVDQAGTIRIVSATGALLEQPFLNLTSRIVPLRTTFDERGLLGLAFHPNYRTNGRFFVYYSAPLRPGVPPERAEFDHTSHVSEFRVSAGNVNEADPASERIILQVDQPQFNHNGGTVAFGPADGFLYVSLGDGGGGSDVGRGHVDDWYTVNAGGNGQDITRTLLGSILRIDVNAGNPYSIPPSNPFVGRTGLDEIWAYGLRNPYRFSFDRGGTRELFVGDAGQELWEEVNIVVRGGNYGWNVKEGTHCFNTDDPNVSRASCPSTDPDGVPLIDPIIEFRNSKNSDSGLGVVVVGGHVYRGEALPELEGRYVFGVWSTAFNRADGGVLVADRAAAGLWRHEPISFTNTAGGALGEYLLGFGEDARGELYLLTSGAVSPTGSSGRVYRMVRAE